MRVLETLPACFTLAQAALRQARGVAPCRAMDPRRDRSPRGRSGDRSRISEDWSPTPASSREASRLRERSLPARNSPTAHRPVSRPRPLQDQVPRVSLSQQTPPQQQFAQQAQFGHPTFSLLQFNNQSTNLLLYPHRRTTLSTFSGRCCKPRMSRFVPSKVRFRSSPRW